MQLQVLPQNYGNHVPSLHTKKLSLSERVAKNMKKYIDYEMLISNKRYENLGRSIYKDIIFVITTSSISNLLPILPISFINVIIMI